MNKPRHNFQVLWCVKTLVNGSIDDGVDIFGYIWGPLLIGSVIIGFYRQRKHWKLREAAAAELAMQEANQDAADEEPCHDTLTDDKIMETPQQGTGHGERTPTNPPTHVYPPTPVYPHNRLVDPGTQHLGCVPHIPTPEPGVPSAMQHVQNPNTVHYIHNPNVQSGPGASHIPPVYVHNPTPDIASFPLAAVHNPEPNNSNCSTFHV